MKSGKIIEAFDALEEVEDVEIDDNTYYSFLYRLRIEPTEFVRCKFLSLVNSSYAKGYKLLLKLSMEGRGAPEISEKTGLELICVRRFLSVPKTRDLLYKYMNDYIDEETFFEKLKRD